MNTGNIRFYSHGKLLLTGEYMVMYGAKSLAVPVKFGQEMNVDFNGGSTLIWDAYAGQKLWFGAEFTLPEFEILQTNDRNKALYLQVVIREAQKINPLFLSGNSGFRVTTRLDYPQEWGLGSSSTFLSNLAYWAGIDPMQLFRSVAPGSGYDIACARASSPILFEISENHPRWEPVKFQPSCSDNVYFAYLGQKQNSAESIKYFKEKYVYRKSDIDFVSDLSQQLLSSNTLESMILILEEHEHFMSSILNLPTVKNTYFSDLSGAVKSLGAWGGDFVIIATPLSSDEVKSYFYNKGFDTLFKFDELVKGDLTPGPFPGERERGDTV